jgi:hypothetical protein
METISHARDYERFLEQNMLEILFQVLSYLKLHGIGTSVVNLNI